MIVEINVRLNYHLPQSHDVLLQIEAAAMEDQHLISSRLMVSSACDLVAVAGEELIGQRTWASGLGNFVVDYDCAVELKRPRVDLTQLRADHPRHLPAAVITHLLPSRYCESDQFEGFVERSFAHVEGGAKIMAMRDWVEANLAYASGTSSGTTTAAQTFVKRQGVCRDYAHLLASFARAATIPARLVSAYAPGVTPPDFHAVVEVWLEGAWHLIDATGMAQADEIVRIGVGRDAIDIAFMTVFGTAILQEQRVSVQRRA